MIETYFQFYWDLGYFTLFFKNLYFSAIVIYSYTTLLASSFS